jgi:uncharacterized protein
MTSDDAHRAAVEAWRSQRYAALRRDTGWLTLAGLAWLRPGSNRIGSDAAADVVLPDGPSLAGTLTMTDAGIVADGVFTHEGSPAIALPLVTDRDAEPTMLALGALRLCVIDRGGRLAVRTWDTDAAARREFVGIDHWPVDRAWRLDGRFEPTPARTVAVPDVLGTIDDEISPGDIVFEVDGRTHRLQALPGGPDGEMWLVFGDATNGSETCGGGRFLYTAAPGDDGSVEIDFNRAYNPPCVFSPYATCPLPWPENRLPIRIEAGERTPAGHG